MTMRGVVQGLLMAASCAALAGCNLTQTAPMSVTGAALHGSVLGGQQPIAGSTLQLYAAGSTGYGSGYAYSTGTSLFGNNVVTTDATGSFGFTGDYTCPSASTEVYLVATGGVPIPGYPANTRIGLMAPLGPCGNLSDATRITINELTTVAGVFALSGFMTDTAHIGTSATNAQGLTLAFAKVNKLVNTYYGQLPGPALPAGATLPVLKINTIADMLAACINSDGGTPGDASNCGVLLGNTTVNGVVPQDTIAAALVMAQHPDISNDALIKLVGPTKPFSPALTSAPNDFSLVVTYTGGGLSTPTGLALDGAGNVWVANSGNNSVTKLDNTGAAVSPSGGYIAGPMNAPAAIAVDASGKAWVANSGNNTVTQLSADGATGTVFSGGGLSAPSSIAIDTSGTVWVANATGHGLTTISGANVASRSAGGVSLPVAVAVNPK
ncbi:MAG: NHL repeat-containing protein [Acidobacteriota bacterium]